MRRETKSRADLRAARKQVIVPVDLLPPTLDATAPPVAPRSRKEGRAAAEPESSPPAPPASQPDLQPPEPIVERTGHVVETDATESRLHQSSTRRDRPPQPGAQAEPEQLVSVRCFYVLSRDQLARLDQVAARIGGVTAEAVLRKAAKDWKPLLIEIDPTRPPEPAPRGGAAKRAGEDRRYRVDFRFKVSMAELAGYRGKHDKLGLMSDGGLLRHFGQPVFEKHLAAVTARLVV